MGFIVKLKKGVTQPVTTTVSEVFLPSNAITFSVFGGVTNNLFGVGESSYGAINTGTGVIFAGDVQFQIKNTNVSIRDNGDNTYEIVIDFNVKARNGRNGVRSVINPTLLIDLSSILTNITSLSTSFTPTRASKQVGIISKSMIGVTFNDIDINQNGIEEFVVDGNLSLNVINGVTPALIRQNFTDIQLPIISSRVERFLNTSDLTLDQRFIFGSPNNLGTQTITLNGSTLNQTATYTNNTLNDPAEFYFAGLALEYDDSSAPSYYFDENDIRSFVRVEQINFIEQTTTTSTTTTSTTAAPPSEPVIFTSETPQDGATIDILDGGGSNTEFNIGISGNVNVPSGMEFRIRLETNSLVNASVLGIENFVDSQNVTVKTRYINGDLLTQDNISSGTILYTYNFIMEQIDITQVSTGVADLVVETNINRSFQETDRISYISKTPPLIDIQILYRTDNFQQSSWGVRTEFSGDVFIYADSNLIGTAVAQAIDDEIAEITIFRNNRDYDGNVSVNYGFTLNGNSQIVGSIDYNSIGSQTATNNFAIPYNNADSLFINILEEFEELSF